MRRTRLRDRARSSRRGALVEAGRRGGSWDSGEPMRIPRALRRGGLRRPTALRRCRPSRRVARQRARPRVWTGPPTASPSALSRTPCRARLARVAHARVPRHERVIADYLKVEGALVPLALPGVRAHICRASKGYRSRYPESPVSTLPAGLRPWSRVFTPFGRRPRRPAPPGPRLRIRRTPGTTLGRNRWDRTHGKAVARTRSAISVSAP